MWLAICWSDFGLCRRAGWPILWRKMSSARYRLVDDSGVVSCPVKPRESDLLDIIIIVYHGVSFMYLLLSPRPYHRAVQRALQSTPKQCILIWRNLTLLPGGPVWLDIFTSLGLFLAPIPRVAAGGRAGPALWSLVMFDAAEPFFCLCSTAGPWMKRGANFCYL